MGLFSFLKNVGAKVLKSADADTSVKTADAEAKHAELLKSYIDGSGLKIDDLKIEVKDDTVTVYGKADTPHDREKAILILGNMDGVASVDDRISVVHADASVDSDMYEVKSGDSLSKIAKKYYGNAMKYNVIFEANKPMLDDPNKIYPGQVLRIPRV